MASLEVHLEVVPPAGSVLTEVAGEGLLTTVGGHVTHQPPARTEVHAAHVTDTVLAGQGEHLLQRRAVSHLKRRDHVNHRLRGLNSSGGGGGGGGGGG